MSSPGLQTAEKYYRRWNRLFWLGCIGIILGPIVALIVSAIVFRAAGSDVSAPIGWSAPFWSVASLALALLVRRIRNAARRSLEIAEFAESEKLEYELAPKPESYAFVAELNAWSNPLSSKARNLVSGSRLTTQFHIMDFRYEHFYGAVTTFAEQTMVVFPELFVHGFEFRVIPKGFADRFVDGLLERATMNHLVPRNVLQRFHVAYDGGATYDELKDCFSTLAPVLLEDPRLCVLVENGTLVVFQELRVAPADELQDLLSTAWNVKNTLSQIDVDEEAS